MCQLEAATPVTWTCNFSNVEFLVDVSVYPWYNAVIALDFRVELGQLLGLGVEYPSEVGGHLALRLIDLGEGKHPLADDVRLVRVGIVAEDFRRPS